MHRPNISVLCFDNSVVNICILKALVKAVKTKFRYTIGRHISTYFLFVLFIFQNLINFFSTLKISKHCSVRLQCCIFSYSTLEFNRLKHLRYMHVQSMFSLCMFTACYTVPYNYLSSIYVKFHILKHTSQVHSNQTIIEPPSSFLF